MSACGEVNGVPVSSSSSPPIKNGAAIEAAPRPESAALPKLKLPSLSLIKLLKKPPLSSTPLVPAALNKLPMPLPKLLKLEKPPLSPPPPGIKPPARYAPPASKAALPNGDLTIFLIGLVIFLTSLPKKYPCLWSSRPIMPPIFRICLSISILEIAIVLPFYRFFIL